MNTFHDWQESVAKEAKAEALREAAAAAMAEGKDEVAHYLFRYMQRS